ncbi:zinc ribbon domain-containing protein [Candidatus Micrarchaeota archaeon]|nr:zinc ribbon domain-containing protein [Candidatus Micrarchaeota archaeon]
MGILDLLLGKESVKYDRCPRCKEKVESYKARCSSCGYSLNKKMGRCPKCKKSIPLEAEKCPSCGMSFKEEQTSKTTWRCPICGYEADYELTIRCPACNTRFV